MASTAPPRPMVQPVIQQAVPCEPASHSIPGRKPVVIPVRKPMRRTRRVSLFERELRIRLSIAAIEILFDMAAVLSEGQLDGDSYQGSTMITIDLPRASVHVSEACDIATAQSVEVLLAGDARVHERARRLGLAAARQRAGCDFAHAQVDVSVHRNGRHLHLDVDIEAIIESMP